MTQVLELARTVAFAAVVAATVLTAPQARAEEEGVNLLFVQTSHGMQADLDKNTLRLIDIGKQTLYFSDRPYRVAGHIPLAKFVDGWNKGDDSFASNPPNAVLSVYEGDEDENKLVVITLLSTASDGDDLVYSYSIVDGVMPASGGVTALFIDKFGVGGGAGAGYHGVGVGARGPGVAGWAGAAVINECQSDGSC